MSLATQIASLATRIATEVKANKASADAGIAAKLDIQPQLSDLGIILASTDTAAPSGTATGTIAFRPHA